VLASGFFLDSFLCLGHFIYFSVAAFMLLFGAINLVELSTEEAL